MILTFHPEKNQYEITRSQSRNYTLDDFKQNLAYEYHLKKCIRVDILWDSKF